MESCSILFFLNESDWRGIGSVQFSVDYSHSKPFGLEMDLIFGAQSA